MKTQQKLYARPRKPFDKARISEENILKEKYGLKNKKEIWKADAAIRRIRNLAKQLITKSEEEKQAFVQRLQKKGFKVESIADALALDKENWLKRRLQTIIFAKNLTNTPKQARQLLVHKHVSIGDQIVNIPSYQVSLEEEPLVRLNLALKIQRPKSKEKPKTKEKVKPEVVDKASDDKKEEVVEEKAKEEITEDTKNSEEVKEK